MAPCNYSLEQPVLCLADYVPDILLTKSSNWFTNPSHLFSSSENVVTVFLSPWGREKGERRVLGHFHKSLAEEEVVLTVSQ